MHLIRFNPQLISPNVPEGLDDVGGDGGSALMRVGLPGECDGVLGHLRHDGLLRRPWQLNELGDSGHRRHSALCFTDERTVHTCSLTTNVLRFSLVVVVFTLSWGKDVRESVQFAVTG